MSEYYAVVRSGDSLSHYGIKGMKWGVRKAHYYESTGNTRSYASQGYRKAKSKLIAKSNKQKSRHARLKEQRLNDKTGKFDEGDYSRRAAYLGGAGLLTGGLLYGDKIYNAIKGDKNATLKFLKNRVTTAHKKHNKSLLTLYGVVPDYINPGMVKLNNARTKLMANKALKIGGVALAAGLLGASAYNSYKAAKAHAAVKARERAQSQSAIETARQIKNERKQIKEQRRREKKTV